MRHALTSCLFEGMLPFNIFDQLTIFTLLHSTNTYQVRHGLVLSEIINISNVFPTVWNIFACPWLLHGLCSFQSDCEIICSSKEDGSFTTIKYCKKYMATFHNLLGPPIIWLQKCIAPPDIEIINFLRRTEIKQHIINQLKHDNLWIQL